MTLNNIARYDKGIVRGETEITPEGFIKAKAIVTRCGVFLYKNADGTVRKELRHPDEVLKEDTMESIKMIPVVNGHPPERLVTAENAKRLAIGYTGEFVENDMPYIIANFMITDKNAIEEILEKKKNELSLGYTVDLIDEKGIYNGEPYDFIQTNIKYNHLAIVDQARAGPEAKIVLDGQDAEEILKEEAKMAQKKLKRIKLDTKEYMLEDEAAEYIEKMIEEKMKLEEAKESLEEKIEELENELDRSHAERDSLRDKDYHDPEKVHHPMQNDEIGAKGKEEMDPKDSYGMQSHVKDYQKPSQMENHVVNALKNEHYPKDLAHIAKVDSDEINRRVKNRVKLEKISEKYLDKSTLLRIDSLSDLEIKKKLIMTLQPNANIEGKSETYINARFDSAIEELPGIKTIVTPSYVKCDEDMEKDQADADSARKSMIKKQKLAYKGGK